MKAPASTARTKVVIASAPAFATPTSSALAAISGGDSASRFIANGTSCRFSDRVARRGSSYIGSIADDRRGQLPIGVGELAEQQPVEERVCGLLPMAGGRGRGIACPGP